MRSTVGSVTGTETYSCDISLPVPLQYSVDHVVYFLVREFGEHRERDTAGGITFGVRNGTGNPGLFAPGVSFLLMDGDRVMALSVDSVFIQIIQQWIAML